MCWDHSLILETRKEGTVNVTKAYSNIIDIINAAEEAANTADRAANDTLQVLNSSSTVCVNEHVHLLTYLLLTWCVLSTHSLSTGTVCVLIWYYQGTYWVCTLYLLGT